MVSGLVAKRYGGIVVNPPAASGSAVVGAVEVFVPLEEFRLGRARPFEKEVAKFEKQAKVWTANSRMKIYCQHLGRLKKARRLVEYGEP